MGDGLNYNDLRNLGDDRNEEKRNKKFMGLDGGKCEECDGE